MDKRDGTHKDLILNISERLEGLERIASGVALLVSGLLIAILSGHLDVGLGADLTSESGEEVARLTIVENNVRRRPAHLPVWVNVSGQERLFQRDQIFTDAGSQARISFDDKADIVLLERSLVVIDTEKDAARLNLVRGEAMVRLAPRGGSLVLEKNGSMLNLRGDEASVYLRRGKANDYEVAVLEGSLQLSDEGGAAVGALEQGSVTAVGSDAEARPRPAIDSVSLISPRDGEVISFESRATHRLTWMARTDGARQIVEIARDDDFSAIDRVIDGMQLSAPVPDIGEGMFYWRVRLETDEGVVVSDVRSFSVLPATPPDLLAPYPWQRLSLRVGETSGAYLFSWMVPDTKTEHRHLIEVAKDADFSRVTCRKVVAMPPILCDDLAAGVYYWRVTVLAPNGGESTQTKPWSFIVTAAPNGSADKELVKSLAAPENTTAPEASLLPAPVIIAPSEPFLVH